MSCTNLNIELHFSQCNGSMAVEIHTDQGLVTALSNQTGIVQINHSMIFPNTVKFKLTNKNPNTDTKVIDGKIVADKNVQLTNLIIGNIPVESHKLFNICNYRYNDQTTINTFWAFNGIVTIDFDVDNFILWHLKLDNKFRI